MTKSFMPHLIVVLPGITGSVLAKDGQDVWAPTPGALWRGVASGGGALSSLALGADDWEIDDVEDGITAPRLVDEVTVIPGLYKTAGYTTLIRALHERFQLIDASLAATTAGNFLPFPYDWRRDNRASAKKLQRAILDCLDRWRKASNNPRARVILLAHSMGGLIARYYLECLEGWRDCIALMTFGTPFRGSPSALGYLANGYKQAFVDVTEVLRSCTSVYQLLPIYPVVLVDTEWRRVSEADAVPGVDRARAAAALQFHRDIETAMDANMRMDEYNQVDYKTLPFVGVYQPTLQSATLSQGRISVSEELPPVVPLELDAGDGTVPRCSAIPIEMSDDFRETYRAERHGILQSNGIIVDDVLNRLGQIASAASHAKIRGLETRPDASGLSLALDDAYAPGEPIGMTIRGVNCTPAAVNIVITRMDTKAPSAYAAAPRGSSWSVEIEPQPPGVYHVKASAVGEAVPSVQDVFIVTPD